MLMGRVFCTMLWIFSREEDRVHFIINLMHKKCFFTIMKLGE